MKENKAKIKGDGNMVFQGITKSEINTAEGKDKKRSISTTIGIVVAIITLIVTVIIGWDAILTFLGV